MKIVMHSDNGSPLNARLDDSTKAMLPNRDINGVMIIASPDVIDFMHNRFDGYLKDTISFTSKVFCNSWDSLTLEQINAIQNADFLFLSGGDTAFLMNALKQNAELLDMLLVHIKSNKVTVAASAGSMILGPTFIDDNTNTTVNGLGITKFQIEPHYDNSPTSDLALRTYTKDTDSFVYALTDGSGIVIDGIKEAMVGKIFLFSKGEKVLASCDC